MQWRKRMNRKERYVFFDRTNIKYYFKGKSKHVKGFLETWNSDKVDQK